MDAGDDGIVEPLPGVPWAAGHGVGKVVGLWDRAGGEHVLAVADVPPDVGIGEQPLSQQAIGRAKQADKENVSKRGQENADRCSGALGSGALGSGALGSGALGSGALGSGALG